MRKIPLLILSLSALLAGCSSTTTQTLNNSDWSMGSDYYQIADIALPAFHLEQDENQQWKITGTTGCNRFFSDFEYQGQQLILNQAIGMTRRLCEPQANTIEQEFLQQLELPIQYDGKQLILANGATLYRINKAAN